MYKTKAFQATVWLLMIFLIIWFGEQIKYIFHPLIVLVTTLFLPVLISGLLYYIINPVVDFISKGRVPRVLAIIAVYLLLFGILSIGVIAISPVLSRQLTELLDNAPTLLSRLYDEFLRIQETGFLSRFEVYDPFASFQDIDYNEVFDNLIQNLVGNITNIAGLIANSAVIIFTIPFILFYMLKEGRHFPKKATAFLPEPYRQESIQLIRKLNTTLHSYVKGQLLVSLFVTIFVFIGYTIVGLDYALLLALISGVANVIPYFGPIIGTIPGLIVGFIQSPWTGLQVLIIIVIVQQLEGQLISPQVLGRRMAIHPVVIIFVLLTAGSLLGIFGLILGIPLFAILRDIVTSVVLFIRRDRPPQENST